MANGGEFRDVAFHSLFENIAQGERLTKSDQIAGDTPFVMSGVTNTGVVQYIGNPVTKFPKNSITIDIFGNTFYRSFDFGASDDVGVYWNSKNQKSKNQMLFIAGAISKALKGQYDYGYKLRASRSLQLTCSLPVLNNEINVPYMENYIQTLQNFIIRDVVAYVARELAQLEKV